MTKKSVEIKLQNGLEARPVAVLVQVASKYDSSIYLESKGKKVNSKSIMGMRGLGLDNGETVTVTAEGQDENAAVEDIEMFLHGALA